MNHPVRKHHDKHVILVTNGTFKLISRINHIGESTESGHYICQLLEENRAEFIEIDNTRIEKGKTITNKDDQEVYICIYEKILSGQVQ